MNHHPNISDAVLGTANKKVQTWFPFIFVILSVYNLSGKADGFWNATKCVL